MRKGRKGGCALKLNMSKANDKIEWVFLLEVTRKMGFSDKWVKLVL